MFCGLFTADFAIFSQSRMNTRAREIYVTSLMDSPGSFQPVFTDTIGTQAIAGQGAGALFGSFLHDRLYIVG